MSSGGGSNITSDLTDLILVANAGNSSFVVTTDSTPSIFVDSDAKVGINTLTPASRLEVNSEDGMCITVRNNSSETAYGSIGVSSTGDVSIAPNGSNVTINKSLNIPNHNGSTVGLKLAGVTVTATAAELNTLSGTTSGTATVGKAIVLNESKTITGLNGLSATELTGTLQTAAQPNITSVGTLSNLAVSGSVSANQLTGTLQTAAQPNITSVGTLSDLTVSGGISANQLTGTLQTAAQPNITSVGNLSSITVAGTTLSDELEYLDGVVEGTAAASKVVVLDADNSIAGLGSVSADELAGTLQTAAQPNITSVGTLSNLAVSGSVSANQLTGTLQTAAQPNITSIGNLSSITVAGNTVGSELSYIKDITAGTAAASKAVVLNSSKSISGVNAISANQLTGTIQTASQPNITEIGPLASVSIAGHSIGSEVACIDNVVAGTATAGKAMVLNSSGAITGVGSLSASSLSGTLQTAAQPQITSVGTLTDLTVGGGVSVTSTTQSDSLTTGALKVAGGVAVAKNIYVGGIIDAQGFKIDGVDLSAGGGSAPSYCMGVTPGTASNGKVLALDNDGAISGILSLSASSIWGELQTVDQPKITSIGELTALAVGGAVEFKTTTDATNSTTAGVKIAGGLAIAKKLHVGTGIYGTLQTSNQSGITQVGTLSGLNVNGAVTFNNGGDSSSSTTGAFTVLGGVGIGKNLYVGTGIYGTLQTGSQTNITQVGTLSSLTVSGAMSASQITGTLQTPSQTNITSVGILTSLDVNGPVSFSSTTESSGYASGALQIAGGVGIAKKLYVEGGMYGTLHTASQPYITAVGTLSSLNVSTDITATDIYGTIQTAAQPHITSVGTLSSLTVSNGITASTFTGDIVTGVQTGITQVGTLTELNVAGDLSITSTTDSSNLTTGSIKTAGGMAITKTLRVGTGIYGTLQTGSQTNITEVGTLTGLTSSGDVAISSATDSTTLTSGSIVTAGGVGIAKTLNVGTGIYGSIQTPSQTAINQVGTLLSLDVSGGVTLGSTTDANSYSSGALQIAGGVGIAKKLYVEGGMYGTLMTGSQPNITSVGTLSTLTVSGDLNGTLATAAQPYITSVGTLTGLVVNGNIEGTLITGPQPHITSVGTLASLNVTGNVSGTLTTGSQPNITSVGTLSSLNVSGSLTLGTTTISASEIGVLDAVVAGTAANSKALVLSSTGTISGISSLSATTLSGTLSTAAQPNITSVGTLSSLTVSGAGSFGSLTVNGVAVGGAPDYVLNITPGTAAASKALVLNSSSAITTGIASLSSTVVRVTGTTNATSATTGSLIVSGGVGITMDTIINGVLYPNNSGDYTFSSSFSNRGLSVNNKTYNNSDSTAGSTDGVFRVTSYFGTPTYTATNTGVTTTNAATAYIQGAPVSGTNNTITNSYALYINGGETYTKGQISIDNSTAATSATTGALVISGGVATGGNSWVGGTLRVASTTASSSSTTGALVVSGGVGVAGDICVKSGSSIGIGLAPVYSLDVQGTSNWATTDGNPNTYRYNGGNGGDGNWNNQTVTICARFNGGVAVTNAAIYVSSDQRLKKDINELSSEFCKQFIQTTTPVSFKYKKDNTLSYGYIAQDLIKRGYDVLTVSSPDENMEEYEDEDGFISNAGSYFNVSYQTVIPILAKGLKTAYEENMDLSAKVDTLNNEINQLKDTNQQMLDMITKLSARLNQLEQN